ncbi:Rieske 2Fe-2S domain-containing protein [Sphingobium sp.]|uniref:Rieske (2Fe-2S) protein n=1 Tax=Sphingobium sp. TaxID=1912891 RepID=UPI0028BD4794|nr:Rieske 2Fe-2S domain-containing protein [Sphingobium sp.]
MLHLCDLDDLHVGSARGFDAIEDGPRVFVVMQHGGRVAGYVDLCPHFWSTGLAWRRDAYLTPDRQHIRCAAHGALFGIDDGVCISGPCLGQRLTPVDLHIADGGIWLDPANLQQFRPSAPAER